MGGFKKFEEKLPRKKRFFNFLTGKKNNNKENEDVLNVWNIFEMKTIKVIACT